MLCIYCRRPCSPADAFCGTCGKAIPGESPARSSIPPTVKPVDVSSGFAGPNAVIMLTLSVVLLVVGVIVGTRSTNESRTQSQSSVPPASSEPARMAAAASSQAVQTPSSFEDGVAALERKDYRSAAMAFEQVLASDPADSAAAFNAGLAYARGGDSEHAASSFEKFLALASPDDDGIVAAKRWMALYVLALSGQSSDIDDLPPKKVPHGSQAARDRVKNPRQNLSP
jgi:hypothetical protein